MKILSTFTCVVLVASCAFGQGDYDAMSLRALDVKNDGSPAEGGDTLCDTLDDLIVGPLDGQVSAAGILWNSFDGTVEDVGGGDLVAQQINTFGDDAFFPEIFADNVATLAPALDSGLVLTLDYEITDINTQRYYSPQDANNGFILTRFGDFNGAGTWGVLETDGFGAGVVVDTGIAIDLVGKIEMVMLDLDLDIFVNGVLVYSGGIIGANGDPGILPGETITQMVFNSGNNFAGLGSEQRINNYGINDENCGGGMKGCDFALGDVNQDGSISLTDVDPFVNLLIAGDFQCEADINEDGAVTLTDVDGFVAILIGG